MFARLQLILLASLLCRTLGAQELFISSPAYPREQYQATPPLYISLMATGSEKLIFKALRLPAFLTEAYAPMGDCAALPTLEPGAGTRGSCVIAFEISTQVAGYFNGQIEVDYEVKGQLKLQRIPVSFELKPLSLPVQIPSKAFLFPDAIVGMKTLREVTLQWNASASALPGIDFTLGPNPLQARIFSSNCASLSAQQPTCSASIEFTAVGQGNYSVPFALNFRTPTGQHRLGQSLTITSHNRAKFSTSVTALDFGRVTLYETKRSVAVKLLNSGPETLAVNSVSASEPFKFLDIKTRGNFPKGAAAEFKLEFNPRREQLYQSKVKITYRGYPAKETTEPYYVETLELDLRGFGDPTIQASGIPPKYAHRKIRFFLPSEFINEVSREELLSRLREYVRDASQIFENNTVVKLELDSVSPFTAWDEDPSTIGTSSEYAPARCQASSHPGLAWGLAAFVSKSKKTFGYGGGASDTCIGGKRTPSAIGMHWTKVYSSAEKYAPEPGSPTRRDYQNAVRTIVHELGHLYGLAIGEYYSVQGMWGDYSGIAPTLTLNSYDPASDYWRDRSSIRNFDPMFAFANGEADYFLTTRFSPMGAVLINRRESYVENPVVAPYPNPYEVDRSDVSVSLKALDRISKRPLAGCEVTFLADPVVQERTLINMGTTPTDEAGIATFRWGTTQTSKNGTIDNILYKSNVLRQFKVRCPGYLPDGAWVTGWDLFAARVFPDGGVVGDYRYPGAVQLEMCPEDFFQNPTNSLDVNADGVVSVMDANLVMSYLNSGAPSVPRCPSNPRPTEYWDVNGDGAISSMDANLVVNGLNAP